MSTIKEYARYWAHKELGMPQDEAAYGLLKAVGMEYRRTNIMVPLQPEEKQLVLAASKFANRLVFSKKLRELFEKDFLDNEEIAYVEQSLLARDGLQVVIDTAKAIADQCHIPIADMMVVAQELDDLLLSRPDIYTVASQYMEPLKKSIKAPVSKEVYWWFYKAREEDKEFDLIDLL